MRHDVRSPGLLPSLVFALIGMGMSIEHRHRCSSRACAAGLADDLAADRRRQHPNPRSLDFRHASISWLST